MRAGHARVRAIVGCAAVAALAMIFASPAAADDGPSGTPPRAAPVPRSYPRGFTSYDSLIAYASDVARAQTTLDTSLAQLRARDDAATAALVAARDPRERGGLLQTTRDAVVDLPSITTLGQLLASDALAAKQLLADGAIADGGAAWRSAVDGELTQPFGPTDVWVEPSREYGGVVYAHFHEAIDVAAPYGTPVVAPAWGRVIFAGMMSDGAEVVVLAHDAGLVSMYAHLAIGPLAPPVSAGDTVRAGDQIGSIGMTGMTTGPHVHMAVWRNGGLIDPLSLIH